MALPSSLVADRPPPGADPTLRVFHYYNRTNALTFLRWSTEDCIAAAQAGVAEAEASGSPGLLAVALSARAGQRVRQVPPVADGAWADARRAVALAQFADVRYVFAIAMGYGLQAASLLEQPEGLDDVLPDLDQWAEIGVEIGNITHLWRFVASALGLLWRRGERGLAIRVRATMDANPWRELGPVVERAVR